MIKVLIYGLFMFPFVGWNQLTVDVNLKSGGRNVELNTPVHLSDYIFQLEQVRFYLSKFEFYKNGQLVVLDTNEAYLVDFDIDSSRKLIFPAIQASEIDEIRFLFGIDSITNVSGAMNGALDPMYGMYWSWQSGYINCKLEGTFLSPKQEAFQLHLGGYAYPFSGVQQVILKTNHSVNLALNIDLHELMDQVIQPKSELRVMSPCIRAVEYTQLLTKSIELKP